MDYLMIWQRKKEVNSYRVYEYKETDMQYKLTTIVSFFVGNPVLAFIWDKINIYRNHLW